MPKPVFIFCFFSVIYGVIAVYLGDFHAFWSPDCGARFAMIRSQIEHERLIYTYYPDADLDPTGQIHPIAYFLFHRGHDFCAMYLPLFPFITGLFYRLFGFSGLMIVPVASGLGTILVTYRTAERLGQKSRRFLPLALGLATPLILYSVIYWDHSAQMLITALAGYWMLRAVQERSFSHAVATGACFGFGMWVQELFLAFFAAAFLAALPFLKGRRFIVSGLLAGFIPLVLLWGAYNLLTYGLFGGAHLGANVVQNNGDHPFSLARILDQPQLAERAMIQLVGTSIFGSRDDLFPYYMAFVGLLILYAFVGWAGTPLRRVALVLGVIAAGMAFFLYRETGGEADGLLEATPLLIPALAVPWYAQRAQGEETTPNAVFYAWASRACGLFILFLLINPMLPGVDWGSRYLLAALPLMGLLAAHALEQQAEGLQKFGQKAALVCIAGIVGISVAFQCYGLVWIQRCLAYGQELNTQIAAIKAPVMVTDTDLNARLTASPTSQRRFCVRTDSDQALFASVVRQLKTKEVVFVGTEAGAYGIGGALSMSGLSFVQRESRPFWKVDHAKEEGGDLFFARFVQMPPNQKNKRGSRG